MCWRHDIMAVQMIFENENNMDMIFIFSLVERGATEIGLTITRRATIIITRQCFPNIKFVFDFLRYYALREHDWLIPLY